MPHAARGIAVGLFGGSFNPPHAGHALVAEIALRRLALQQLWWIVTPGNPLKAGRQLAPLGDRLARSEAIATDPRIKVTAFEAAHRLRYTGDTLALGLEPHVFRVGSVAPPGPVAWSGETFVEGEVEWLALPDPEQPDVLIQADPELRGIGATVWEFGEDGQQFGVSFCGGHFRGHCDGVAQGLPEAPKTPHLLEFKTHSSESFNELRNKGVREAKPVHYDQMQVYMHGLELTRALYLAVNKDTDELYSERLEYSQSHALAIIARAESIIAANEPPPRCSDNPAYYLCKMCEFAPICHGQQMPCVNCRTCTHSTPDMKNDDGRWICALAEQDIPDDVQYIGCDMHLYIPAFLQARNASVADASPEENWIEYVLENGKSFRNGPRDDDRRPESGMFDSWEIRAACADGDLSLLTDAELNQIREKFSARVGEAEHANA